MENFVRAQLDASGNLQIFFSFFLKKDKIPSILNNLKKIESKALKLNRNERKKQKTP